MKNFWQDLSKPFTVLAPMDDVTDVVFREVVARVSSPDVFFTEFTNVDGLFSAGRQSLIPRLKFTENQKPIVAQIWGLKPDNYFKAAQLIKDLGFDGIDINMGCPEKNIRKNGACSALMKNRPLAGEIIDATRKGSKGLPLSIKTRIGMYKIDTENWLSFLLRFRLDALIVHGRTVSEMSKVSTHWDEIGKAVNLRNNLGVETMIIGNGDVESMDEVRQKYNQYKVDGVMIGRGIFKNIRVFDKSKSAKKLSQKESIKLLLFHCKMFVDTYGESKNFAILRKFFKIYTSGFTQASNLRDSLMKVNSYQEVTKVILEFSNHS